MAKSSKKRRRRKPKDSSTIENNWVPVTREDKSVVSGLYELPKTIVGEAATKMADEPKEDGDRRGDLRMFVWDVNPTDETQPEVEVFLSYSEDRRRQNLLKRTGRASPSMLQDPPWNEYLSDSEVQWEDSYFIDDESRQAEILNCLAQLVYAFHLYDTGEHEEERERDAFWRKAKEDLEKFAIAKGRDSKLASKADFLGEDFSEFVRGSEHHPDGNRIVITRWGNAPDWLEDEVPLLRIRQPPEPFRMATSIITIDSMVRRSVAERGWMPKEIRKWLFLLDSHWHAQRHIRRFERSGRRKGYEIIGHQGCGDLSLNLWHVAFIREPFGIGRPKGTPLEVIQPEEDVNNKEYYCLVRWQKPNPSSGRLVEFTKLEFRRLFNATDHKQKVLWDGEPVGDDVVFAVSGKPIVWDGEDDLAEWIHLYADLRHVFELPNLNPVSAPRSFRGQLGNRPRAIFCKNQWDDVWLGEAALLEDRNLRRAALRGPILLSPQQLGTYEEHVKAALKWEGMRPKFYGKVDRIPEGEEGFGKYREVKEGHDTLFEIFFRQNVYPVSILGITEDGKLLSFILQCPYSEDDNGLTLRETAKILKEHLGVTHALIFEEGNDPYVTIPGTHRSLRPKRKKRPAVFVFASAR